MDEICGLKFHLLYLLVAVTSSVILKAKQKPAVTFNSDKHDVIDGPHCMINETLSHKFHPYSILTG